MFTITATIALIGLALSIYALYIEKKLKSDATYHPVCDISDKISCSKTFLSPYGKLFGISNTLIGIGFYAAVLLCASLEQQQALQLLAAGSLAASVFLAYILYFKVKTICMLCTAIYVVNIALAVAVYFGL